MIRGRGGRGVGDFSLAHYWLDNLGLEKNRNFIYFRLGL